MRPFGQTIEWNDTVRVWRCNQVVAQSQIAELRAAMLAATAAKQKQGLKL